MKKDIFGVRQYSVPVLALQWNGFNRAEMSEFLDVDTKLINKDSAFVFNGVVVSVGTYIVEHTNEIHKFYGEKEFEKIYKK